MLTSGESRLVVLNQSLRHFWLSQLVGVGCYFRLVGRGNDAAKHPIVHRTTPTAKITQPQMPVVLMLTSPAQWKRGYRLIVLLFSTFL